MDIKELKALREKPQAITNILDEDFYYKWDWIEYSIKKWETKQEPYYLAENCALHMTRKYCTNEKLNYHKEWGKIVDEIMWKEYIEYDKLTVPQASILCTQRWIDLKIDWKNKNRATLISDLKKTH